MKLTALEDISKLISDDTETDSVEYKESTGQLERGMETLCAFLNKEGGTVLFGVNDNKKIIGQEVADTTKRNIADAISRLEPTAAVQISYIPLSGSDRKVIALHVEDARFSRPYSYKGRPYIRVESVTTTMPQATYERLLLLRDGGKYRWELFGNKDLTLQDIDSNEVRKTVRLGIEYGRLPEDTGDDLPVIMEKLGLLKNGILNHAAAVLFASHEMPEPEYRLGNGFVVLVFRFGENNGINTVQVPTRLSVLVKVLGNKELSVRELMDELGLTHRPTFRMNYLHPALNEGYIIPLYPDQPHHPKQKYCLTDKGKALLNG